MRRIAKSLRTTGIQQLEDFKHWLSATFEWSMRPSANSCMVNAALRLKSLPTPGLADQKRILHFALCNLPSQARVVTLNYRLYHCSLLYTQRLANCVILLQQNQCNIPVRNFKMLQSKFTQKYCILRKITAKA